MQHLCHGWCQIKRECSLVPACNFFFRTPMGGALKALTSAQPQGKHQAAPAHKEGNRPRIVLLLAKYVHLAHHTYLGHKEAFTLEHLVAVGRDSQRTSHNLISFTHLYRQHGPHIPNLGQECIRIHSHRVADNGKLRGCSRSLNSVRDQSARRRTAVFLLRS